MFKLLEKFEQYEMGIININELKDAIKAYNMSTDNRTAFLSKMFELIIKQGVIKMSNFEKFLETLQGVLIGLLGASVLYFLLHIVAYLTNRPQILGL